jgi:hypothetical protein
MPEPSYKRILLRAVRKQEIFNKIANINTDELRHYVDDHFDKESHHLFKDKISLLSNNLLDAHAKFAKASILHEMACKSLGIENTEQASKTKSQGIARADGVAGGGLSQQDCLSLAVAAHEVNAGACRHCAVRVRSDCDHVCAVDCDVHFSVPSWFRHG